MTLFSDGDLGEAMALFELAEVTVRRALRFPEQIRRGVDHGRLRFHKSGEVRLVHRRLAYRKVRSEGFYIVLRRGAEVVRLHFA